ncbi:MAG: microcompartment protein [Synergistaceae bacterium]|jgi:hypothetical protein|nr:microcompartment protein [Synergistaceae bacterium]
MALFHKFINAPSASTRKILTRRILTGRASEEAEALNAANWGAVLLVQGTIPDMFGAVDVGSKASSALAVEVTGNCPQNIVTMAFIGNVADVKQVLSALKSEGVIA